MDIQNALRLWVEITGVNPNNTRIRLKDMDIHSANHIIEKSIQFDTSYVTTLMLLNTYLDDFVANRTLMLKDILADFSIFTSWLNQINEFKGILNSEEVSEIKLNFKENLKQALAHYKVSEKVVEIMVENENNLAEIRYSAFNAISTLEVRQFAQGSASQKSPVVYENVYLFKDVNTLLEWMLSVDSGIVLAMIQDSDLSSAFFVFAIRNGGTLTLVTDRERTAHPLESRMSRNRARGREFFSRITNYHFPYSVMDIEFGDNDRAYVTSEEKALVNRQEGITLAQIRELEPDEIVWIVMMFGLLNEKFFKQNHKTESLSYTAKMMLESNMLLEQAQEHGIVLLNYQPLLVPVITNSDMTTEKLKHVFRVESTGMNDWMVERYSVPAEVFDVLQTDTQSIALTDGSHSSYVALEKLPLSNFNDAERLQSDRLFLARYNQAKAIEKRLKAEYNERKDEVKEWYKQAVRKNMGNLLEAIAKNKFFVADKEHAHIAAGGWTQTQKDGNILRIGIFKDESYQGGVFCSIGGESHRFGNVTCAVKDTKAFLVGHFHPRNGSQIAEICGCDISELHELIRHWKYSKEPNGNQISDRVDPLDWALDDPWLEVRFDVRIFLSKKGYNSLCKEHKTGNDAFWNKKEVEEGM